MTPLALLLLIPLVLAALGWTKQIYPRPSLVLWALFPAMLSLGLILGRQFIPGLVAFDLLVAAVLLVDLATLPARGTFFCEREMGKIASLQKPHAVKLSLGNRAARTFDVALCDDVPQECEATPGEFALRASGQSRSTVEYLLRPRRRGAFRMEAVYLRVASRLKLWQRFLTYPAQHELYVYPDMRQLREYAILARTDRLNLMGMRRARRVGQDNEFERLRDYTPDDNYKHIDWRSTARRGKLTVKDFQVNQSQRVVFMIDCGRMMTLSADGISLLDHALNAALMLSYVALTKGDSVGLVCFSDEIERYVPPRGGMNQMNRLLHASFDRFARLTESRYDEAFVYLNAHCRKRSLVILITNIIDEVNSNQVGQHLARLTGRHLPLAVLLRDHRVFAAAGAAGPDEAALYRAAAASEIIDWRRGVLADLESQGVLSLDAFPEHMTAPLVNRYLEIKARHLL